MSDDLGSLAAALNQLQANLPHIGKTATGHHGRYADLPEVTRILLPRLAELGLCFTACPTMEDGQFGLRYKLWFAADYDDSIGGFYPLPNGTPQTIGGAITYARRYALLAVTGVAPDEDDDDGQAAEQEYRALQRRPPETRADGSATEAEQYRMTHGPVPGTWRSTGTAENDPYYDPGPDAAGAAMDNKMRAMFAAYRALGITGKDEMLADLSAILGRPIGSRKDLNLSELTTVGAILRRRAEQGDTP